MESQNKSAPCKALLTFGDHTTLLDDGRCINIATLTLHTNKYASFKIQVPLERSGAQAGTWKYKCDPANPLAPSIAEALRNNNIEIS